MLVTGVPATGSMQIDVRVIPSTGDVLLLFVESQTVTLTNTLEGGVSGKIIASPNATACNATIIGYRWVFETFDQQAKGRNVEYTFPREVVGEDKKFLVGV